MKNIFKFDFSNFKGDLFGGLTAGIVALPLALAFGLQSGMGAAAGLYGAIFISFFAAWLGGTNTQISGPTAPMTAVSMVIVAGIVATNEGDLEKAIPAILIVFLLAGLIQIALGFLRIGGYIRYMPYPVVSGFMTGIGVIILITQILPLIGYYAKEDASYVEKFRPQAEEVILERILRDEAAEDILVLEDFKETIKRASTITPAEIQKESIVLARASASGVNGSLKTLPRALQNINYIDLILGLLTIFIIYGFKRITTAIPSTLVALVAITIGAVLFLPAYRTIGEIPAGFPSLRLDIFANFQIGQIIPYIASAISLAALGAIDSLLTSVVADNMTKTKHDPNQELFGQGIGNSIAALFGGIPGAGATIRTVVNINSGGMTRLSGMFAGVILLVVLLVLGPIASMIPAAVLAGILITVGIGVMDYKGLRHIRSVPLSDALVMVTVLFLTVFVDLLIAVAVGMILSAILFMKKISDVIEHRTEVAPLQTYSQETPWNDESVVMQRAADKIYIKHLDGPLFFGTSSQLQNLLKQIPRSVEVVIFRMDRVPYMDQSGMYAIDEVIDDLQKRGTTVLLTGLNEQPRDQFERVNIIPDEISEEHIFDTFTECYDWVKSHVNNMEGVK
ncbi:MAG: SulP family inorganic anion transporter [Saprospiraceae bacterium]